MANTDIVIDNFRIVKCPRCDTQKIEIIDIDGYNQVLIFKCNECREEFTKPAEVLVSPISHTLHNLPRLV